MCRGHLKAFLPGGERHAVLAEKSVVGGGYRSNVDCPICGSFDRERLDANFGYRRGRSTKDALRKVWKEIEAGREWIVDASNARAGLRAG
jgi:hypothetical protein